MLPSIMCEQCGSTLFVLLVAGSTAVAGAELQAQQQIAAEVGQGMMPPYQCVVRTPRMIELEEEALRTGTSFPEWGMPGNFYDQFAWAVAMYYFREIRDFEAGDRLRDGFTAGCLALARDITPYCGADDRTGVENILPGRTNVIIWEEFNHTRRDPSRHAAATSRHLPCARVFARAFLQVLLNPVL
eukprot:TRINITY_DN1556_c1_g4_i1.p1 TRINITY_DN1556_c1_g4~~TRINITY_DN1556_c1_g4_i1.p1  ORF type:complete len:186 (-),score=24.00 TRINITY_DN1556_c1_g4_i1:8-565(-)